MAKFESKNTILTKKINNIVYELLVKTHADMVYVGDKEYTLTEKLYDICSLLEDHTKSYKELNAAFKDLMKGSDESFNSFKEIWDYINVNGDPKSELIKLIESKQASEEGKGLSTHDLTDILYEKLINDYTKEELNEKFRIIIEEKAPISVVERVDNLEKRVNIITVESANTDTVRNLPDYSIWYQIIPNVPSTDTTV